MPGIYASTAHEACIRFVRPWLGARFLDCVHEADVNYRLRTSQKPQTAAPP